MSVAEGNVINHTALIEAAAEKIRLAWNLASKNQASGAFDLFEQTIAGEYNKLGFGEDIIRRLRRNFAQHLIKNQACEIAYDVYAKITARSFPVEEAARAETQSLATSMFRFACDWLYPNGKILAATDLLELSRNIWRSELGNESAAKMCQGHIKLIHVGLPLPYKSQQAPNKHQSSLARPGHKLNESKSSNSLDNADLVSRLEKSALAPGHSGDEKPASTSQRPRSFDIQRDIQRGRGVHLDPSHFQYTGFDTKNGILLGAEQATTDDAIWFRYLRGNSHPVLDGQPRRKSGNVKIAILDTGIDGKHEFFSNFRHQIKAFKSWIEPERSAGPDKRGLTASQLENVCTDDYGHGSLVTSLLLRVTPYADLYVAQVAKDTDDISADHVASAIKWAIQTWKVDIISLSLGFQNVHSSIRSSLRLTVNDEAVSTGAGSQKRQRNVLVFAAASNEGANVGTDLSITYPASDPSVICVDATESSGKPWSFNPQGNREYGLCSMGVKVRGPWPAHGVKNNMKEDSGTSYATPILAGIAALLLEFLLQEFSKDGVPEIYEELRNASTGSLKHVLRGCARKQDENFYYITPMLLDMDLKQHGSVNNARRETLATVRRKMHGRLDPLHS